MTRMTLVVMTAIYLICPPARAGDAFADVGEWYDMTQADTRRHLDEMSAQNRQRVTEYGHKVHEQIESDYSFRRQQDWDMLMLETTWEAKEEWGEEQEERTPKKRPRMEPKDKGPKKNLRSELAAQLSSPAGQDVLAGIGSAVAETIRLPGQIVKGIFSIFGGRK